MNYKSSKAWQKCDDLVVAVYQATASSGARRDVGQDAILSHKRFHSPFWLVRVPESEGANHNHRQRQQDAGRARLDLPPSL